MTETNEPRERVFTPDAASTRESIVFKAIGAASTCWDNLADAGIFESVRAKHIGQDLIAALDEHERPIRDVVDERERQDAKWGMQSHPSGTGGGWSRRDANTARSECNAAAENGFLTWRHILTEEVFEALAEDDPAKLRAELIQVAAVCVAWAEHIDRG